MKKRIISRLFIFIICISQLASCSSNKSKLRISSDVYDCCDSGINWYDYFREDDLETNKSDYEKEKLIGTEKSITVDGVVYTGKYDKTVGYELYSPSMFDRYSDNGVSFEIKEDTGTILNFSKKTENCDVLIDEEDGKERAEEILSDIIDIENFKYIGSEEALWGKNLREYVYRRYIDGIKMNEEIRVYITGNGELDEINGWGLGEFKNFELPKNFNADDVQQSAYVKIEEIVNSQKDIEIDSYSIELCEEPYLAHIKNGYYYMTEYKVILNIGGEEHEDLVSLHYLVKR